MGNKMFFQSFIDVDSWNKAGWKGTAYVFKEDGYPHFGILFDNKVEGEKIFDGWLKRIGNSDIYEELYISIVEGEIEGIESGYSVLISSDILATKKRAKDEKLKFDFSHFGIVSRIHRMHPSPNSKNLAIFKENYKKHKEYRVIPVYSDSGELHPDFDRAILKTKIHFKLVEDIGKDDLERAILDIVKK